MHCAWTVTAKFDFSYFFQPISAHRALFMDPQISLFNNFFIKNWSHGTIHTFKNYFTTVFFSFSFQFSAVSKRTLRLRLDPAFASTFAFAFFFFFFPRVLGQILLLWLLFMHCAWIVAAKFDLSNNFQPISAHRALFMYPYISLNFFIKNGSHGTIHTFKSYFATVFFNFQFSVSVFSFQLYSNRP